MAIFNVDVEINITLAVEADNEDHAWQVARAEHWEAVSDERPEPIVHVTGEAAKLSQLKDGWNGECLPYGGDGNTRLKDILPE